jgi:RNA polymerase sigma-70 factor (ECF subfamily)
MNYDLTIKTLSDEELVKKIISSGHYFDELINRYSHKLYKFMRPKLKSDEDTEDLLQEVFFKTYNNIHRYNSRWRFSTWIYTSASRIIISYYRSGPKIQRSSFPPELKSSSPGPAESMLQQEGEENLWAYARQLKKNQFNVLWLKYIEDMSVKEIARTLNKSGIYIRVLLHRARQSLMERFSDKFQKEG